MDLLNYELYDTDSPTLAGGAAIYITKTLKSITRPGIKFYMHLVELCWVEIDPCNGKARIFIGCIYIDTEVQVLKNLLNSLMIQIKKNYRIDTNSTFWET